jgi:RHS repeat-associated protein
MTDSTGTETYTYNQMGWPTQVVKVINGVSYTIGYGYDGLGDLTQITYPSGRAVGNNYDAIGRLQSVTNNSATALTVNSYNAAGEATAVSYGNSVAGSFSYNDHLQLSSLSYVSGTNTLLNLTYNYGTQNNGQIQSITDSRGSAYSTTYTYDPLNRLAAAQTSNLTAANTWALAWKYDRYGNRLSQVLTGGTMSVGQPQLTIDPTTNRITNAGFAYDANGNMTNDGIHAYSYDADNRTVQVDGGSTASYSYDAKRLRVVKGSTTYVYSGTKVIAEYSSGTVQKEYIYAGSGLLATLTGTGTTYHHPDHLSNRVETDGTGNVVRTFGSLPFGDTWYETGPSDKWKFTSYERDTETGLDYALMRYSSSGRLGRFMSPDPLSGDLTDPQSHNRFLYVRNDPINLIDPLGLQLVTVTICGYKSITVTTGPPDDQSSHQEVALVCEQTLMDIPDQVGPPSITPNPSQPPGGDKKKKDKKNVDQCKADIDKELQKIQQDIVNKYINKAKAHTAAIGVGVGIGCLLTGFETAGGGCGLSILIGVGVAVADAFLDVGYDAATELEDAKKNAEQKKTSTCK